MQRVRLRRLTFPLAFLLPILLAFLGAQHEPPRATGHKMRAALVDFREPSPEIDAALSAQRRRIIAEAEGTRVENEATRTRMLADAEVAKAIEAKNAQEAAEVLAAQEAEEAKVAATKAAAIKAEAVKAAAAKAAKLAAAEAAAPRAEENPTPRVTGSMPPNYIKMCESGGNYSAVNPNGHYGAWQFSQATWNGVGGTGRPDRASPAEQDYRASILWNNGRGAGNWSCA